MEDSELHIQSIRKYFTNNGQYTFTEYGAHFNRSKIAKLLQDFDIHIPHHLDNTINEKIREELKL